MKARETLVNTWEGVERLFRILRESRHVTLDVETSGLDWRKNHIVGWVITPYKEDSMYVPVRHLGGGNLPGCQIPVTPEGWKGDLHPFEIELAKIAAEVWRRWVGHNFIFDLRFCHRHGVELYGEYEDSMVNAPLIDENQFSFSLDNVARLMEVQSKKGQELYQYISDTFDVPADKKSMGHFWRTNAEVPIVWQYAAGDGVTTEEVWDKQQVELDDDSTGRNLRTVHNVENRLIKTLYRMTKGGIRIDEDELHRVDREFADLVGEASKQLPPGFKTNSPKNIKELLGDRIDDNWPRNPVTKAEMVKASKEGRKPKGAPKFDEATLMMVPEGRLIIDTRKMEHARSTFTGPMIERHLHLGRVFCEFNQMVSDDYGAISGRLSSSNPNMQQVPKRDKRISKPYRRAFLPEEGHIWYDNDYKQQEYVVFTDYTGDPILMKGYEQDPPVDIHQSVADMLSVERDPTAKRMNLGMLYGMGVAKLALSLGVSVAQAQKWMDQYHRKFPYAKKFLKGAERRARQRGYVFTYLGRRRRFPDPRFAHKAGNGVIQGSSADITKLKMVEIDEYFASEGDVFRLMLQCHDSLSWSGPKDRPDINSEAVRIMRDFDSEDALIKMRVPLGVDSDTGRNWSEATFGV